MPETMGRPLLGLIIPELKNRDEDSLCKNNLQSRHLERQAAEAQPSTAQPCTWPADSSESPPLTVSPSASNIPCRAPCFLASICYRLQFYPHLAHLFDVCLPSPPDRMVCGGRCQPRRCFQHLAHHAWPCPRNSPSAAGWGRGWTDKWKGE